jgi:hypothetical protein
VTAPKKRKPTRKPGRPVSADTRTTQIAVRLTAQERETLVAAASPEDFASWARAALLEAAGKPDRKGERRAAEDAIRAAVESAIKRWAGEA